jgi:Zn-dependent oligopeptidase
LVLVDELNKNRVRPADDLKVFLRFTTSTHSRASEFLERPRSEIKRMFAHRDPEDIIRVIDDLAEANNDLSELIKALRKIQRELDQEGKK